MCIKQIKTALTSRFSTYKNKTNPSNLKTEFLSCNACNSIHSEKPIPLHTRYSPSSECIRKVLRAQHYHIKGLASLVFGISLWLALASAEGLTGTFVA